MNDANESTTEWSSGEGQQLAEESRVQPTDVTAKNTPTMMQDGGHRNGISPGFDELVRLAEATVRVYSPAEAINLLSETDVLFVDVRDAIELSGGKIRGAIHASRGRLEAHLDPATRRYRRELADADQIIFYCASGARSALAAQRAQELGYMSVGHIDGGISAWKGVGGPMKPIEEG